MNKPQETPGPWQREPGPFGRRYRMEKGVKCYEMTVNGVPQSQLEEHNRRQREEQAQKVEAAQRKAAELERLRRRCPFIDDNNSHTDCTRESCALFLKGRCSLSRLTPAGDTMGRRCPFSAYRRNCEKGCALYQGGCSLTGIFSLMESEE